MEYRLLGKTGIRVSELCMGTMTFGREADMAESTAMFRRCREAGVNFFDCANVYAGGESERILGKLIADSRPEVIITSKVYFPVGPDPNAHGLSCRHIKNQVEASLKRLNTDYIDVYYLHHFDECVALEESLRTVEDLVRQGKIICAGASNFSAWQFEKALGIEVSRGWSPLTCIQPMYNLIKRQAEVEILPMALHENVAVVTYSPLAGGLLSGKYQGETPQPGRFDSDEMYRSRYRGSEEISFLFKDLAKNLGFNPVSLAVAWVAHHPAVTCPIIGARNAGQLEASLGALDIDMTEDLHARLCALSAAPPTATDRSDEVV